MLHERCFVCIKRRGQIRNIFVPLYADSNMNLFVGVNTLCSFVATSSMVRHLIDEGVGTFSFVTSIITVVFCLFTTGRIRAQEASDADIVDVGKIEFEANAVYESETNDVRTETFSAPETEIEAGVFDQTQVALEWVAYAWEEVNDGPTAHGTGEGIIGVKRLLTKETVLLPRTALLGEVTFPTGEGNVVDQRVEPTVLGVFETSFDSGLSLESHAGVEWSTVPSGSDAQPTETDGVYATALFYEVTPSMAFFAEAYGAIPVNRGETPEHVLDAGVEYAFANQFEIVTWYGRGISDVAPDRIFTMEFTFETTF